VAYQLRWRHATVQNDLAIRIPTSMGERVSFAEYFPRIRTIRSSWHVDSLRVEPLYGQTPEDWTDAVEALRHVSHARRCQVREETTGFVWLDFYFADPLAAGSSAIPSP
jgi:S-DNA-T family DNA segregation ATPase FtsK/SpoIIIE